MTAPFRSIRGRQAGSARIVAPALAVAMAITGCGTAPTPTPAPTAETSPASSPAVGTPSAVPPTGSPVDADLAVWSDHDSAPALGTVTYHVHYANLGLTVPARGAVLRITPPEGTRLGTGSEASTPLATGGGGIEVALGTIEPSTIGVVNVDVEWTTTPAPGTWTELTAQLTAADPDPDATNNTATDGERVPGPDLRLTLRPAESSAAFTPGATVTYRLALVNVSTADAPAASLALTLPKGLTFVSAGGSLAGKVQAAAAGDGTLVTLPLSAVRAMARGTVEVRAMLGADLAPGLPVTASAVVSAAGETSTADNTADFTEAVQAAGADVWVALDSKGSTELNGKRAFRLRYGNRGTVAADGVSLSLEIPASLANVKFGLEPTAIADGVATWAFASLPKATGTRAIEITATIAAAGSADLRAGITTATADENTGNGTAEAAAEFVDLAMPVISGPVNAFVGARPVFFGTGRSGATVSLSLVSADGLTAEPLGTGTVDGNGRWEIQPATDLPSAGWHWFTATQRLGDLVSPGTGVADFATPDTSTDPNSLTVDGKRVGGINQVISWPGGTTLVFGARVSACAKPLSPMLQADYYTADDVMVNRQLADPKGVAEDGTLEFAFVVPRLTQEVQWQLSLAYYCESPGQSRTRSSVQLASYTAGLLEWLDRTISCWFGNCPPAPPEPPPPRKFCPGCGPAEIPKKPAPNFMSDPEDKWVMTRWPVLAFGERLIG